MEKYKVKQTLAHFTFDINDGEFHASVRYYDSTVSASVSIYQAVTNDGGGLVYSGRVTMARGRMNPTKTSAMRILRLALDDFSKGSRAGK